MSFDFESLYSSFVEPFIAAHHGKYAPNYEKAASNLRNSPDDNLKYLGTYFPRTVLESLSVFSFLLDSMKALRDALGAQKTLRVLDFGCGTGGELIGFLAAYQLAFPEQKPAVEIRMIDGNNDALSLAIEALEAFEAFSGMHADLFAGQCVLNDGTFLQDHEFVQGTFDVILTSKFLNEMNDVVDHPYSRFISSHLPRLSEDGIAVIQDLTCLQSARRGGQWANQQMFNEVSRCLRNAPKFRTLFPIICDACRSACCKSFPQLAFDFSSLGFNVHSNLACRVICREGLWRKVRAEAKPAVHYLSCKHDKVLNLPCVEAGGQNRMAPMPRCTFNLRAASTLNGDSE